MNIPFLKQLRRLAGPVVQEVVLAPGAPPGVAIGPAMQHLLAELPDVLMAAVVEVATGKPLATYTADRDLRPGAVAGFQAEAVRQVQASLRAQGLTGEAADELLFTLPSQLHLIHLAAAGQLFVYLAVDCHDTNLGIAREVMRTSIERLERPV